jgi:hypothetical protein
VFGDVSLHLQLGLPASKLWTVDDVFGGWAAAQSRFFDAGAILDVIQEAVSGDCIAGAHGRYTDHAGMLATMHGPFPPRYLEVVLVAIHPPTSSLPLQVGKKRVEQRKVATAKAR